MNFGILCISAFYRITNPKDLDEIWPLRDLIQPTLVNTLTSYTGPKLTHLKINKLDVNVIYWDILVHKLNS